MRVLLVDDHPVFRAGLKALLKEEADLEIVGEAATAREAFLVAEATKPEVAVLDIALPGSTGIAATRELRRRLPRCKVLILSMHARESFVARALVAGASGYAIKEQPPAQLVEAIRTVGRGGTYVAPQVPREAVDELARRLRSGEDGILGALSKREQEIFDLLVRGDSNGTVAHELCISQKTVETHRARIFRKLGVHSVADLIRLAAANQLLD